MFLQLLLSFLLAIAEGLVTFFVLRWTWRNLPSSVFRRPWVASAVVFFSVTGALAFLTLGIDADDIQNGEGFTPQTHYPPLPLRAQGLSLDWSLLDWSSAPRFAEVYRRLHIPGQVGVCISDIDSGGRYCVEICRSGLLIDKNRWHVERVSLPTDCLSLANDQVWVRRITLAQFAVTYVQQERRGASRSTPKGGQYVEISAAPLENPDVAVTYQAATKNPRDITAWLRLAFVDLRSVSLQTLYRGVAGHAGRPTDMWSLEPLFRFGRNNEVAKFGLTKYLIDDYGDRLGSTATYEIVETVFDRTRGEWSILNVRTVQENVPRDVDMILGAGLVVRVLVYGIATLFGTWVGLGLLRKALGVVRSAGSKHEVVIKVEGVDRSDIRKV